MLLEHCNPAFGGSDTVIVGWDEVDVHMVALDVHFNSLEHSLSITLSVGEYLQALRLASMSVNAAIMAPLILEGMVWTRMAFRS
jgi:hypothetical protein